MTQPTTTSSPFDWRNKPSTLLSGKDKHYFNGVNKEKSNRASKSNPIPIYLKPKSKINNKKI